MKQKDIITVIVVAFISGTASFFLANAMFGGDKVYKLTAPNVETIKPEFAMPDVVYFNKGSLNPTKNIRIGDSTNNDPFKASK